MSETAYLTDVAPGHELAHAYGPHVHVLSDAWALATLSRVCSPDTATREVHAGVDACYRRLIHAATAELPTAVVSTRTRMAGGVFHGRVLAPSHPVVVVDVARAGMFPSHVVQQALLGVLHDSAVRVDHVYMQRVSDPVTGEVLGVQTSGSKIGGTVDGATVVIPDPMGATGGSMADTVALYRGLGAPHKFVCLHLMITPEYLARMRDLDVQVYALRLDRGLSSERALAAVPGTLPDEERGLDERCYIVPGAGGMGEVLNNAWV